MKNHYEKGYHRIVHKNLLENRKYYLFRAKLSKRYWKYLNGNVLEFGCGLGQNIFLNKDRSVGVEVSEFCIKECEKRGIKVFNDIRKIKNKVNGVLCVHVLEHLRNPDGILGDFNKALEDNGVLVLVLPESEKNKIYKDFKPDIGKHLFGWNFNHINELLYANGFKIMKNEFNYGYGYSVFYKFLLGDKLVKLFGILMRRREMIIVARK